MYEFEITGHKSHDSAIADVIVEELLDGHTMREDLLIQDVYSKLQWSSTTQVQGTLIRMVTDGIIDERYYPMDNIYTVRLTVSL